MAWFISILLLVVGGWGVVCNWVIVVRGLLGYKSGSWVPLIPGALTALGLWLLPVDAVARWWWVPLLVDWGCVPGFVHLALWLLFERRTGGK